MSKYIAFLRAINVGGRTVKMERLRESFETLGFLNVETFIASGNVIFDSDSKNPRSLETLIEAGLSTELGFEAPTFIRTSAELGKLANYKAFQQSEIDKATALNICFLKSPLDNDSINKLMERKNEIDDFAVHEREMYWLCHKKQSDSTFSNAVLEKTTGSQSTMRGLNTIIKMAEKWAT